MHHLCLAHKHTCNQIAGTLIEAARNGTGSVSRFIGRSRSEDSVCNTIPANNNGGVGSANKGSASRSNSAGSEEGVTASPTDSNPSMDKPDNAPTNKSSSSSSPSTKYKSKEHHIYGSRCSDLKFIFIFFVCVVVFLLLFLSSHFLFVCRTIKIH